MHTLFSPTDYIFLTKHFLSQGYRVVAFDAVSPDERHLIVRHDVDFCLQRAADMAKIEAAMEISATYFVLLSSEFYNIFSPHSQKCLHDILACGHRIGLHFDPTAHDDPESGIEKDKKALEMVIGEMVTIMSFHRPHKEWLNSTRRICDLPHTYEPRFFSEIAYVSDSRGGWHHGHPYDHQALVEGRALQLLTHPIWWMHECAGDFTPTKVLLDFFEEKKSRLHSEIEENCTSFQP